MWKTTLILSSSMVLAVGAASAFNEGCSTEKEILVCDIQVGQTISYEVDGGRRKSLKLVNNTGGHVLVKQVKVQPTKTNSWGEYCLSIRDWLTRQDTPGYGEVGCIAKNPSEEAFGALQWDNSSSGLSVAPGQSIYVGGYVQDPETKGRDYQKIVQVTLQHGTQGSMSYRQPKVDKVIKCTGQSESTEWSPWQNTTGRDIKISGATIYAASPVNKSSVDTACLYILDAAGKPTKWKECSNMNVQGRVRFSPVTVAPNQYIAAQANHNCRAGGVWDWAAFIYTDIGN